MKTATLFSRPTSLLASLLAVSGCDPTPAPSSATQDAPPFFSPVDAGQDAGARDAGTDAGVDAGADGGTVDGGGADAGTDGGTDAGTLTPGITIVSSNNRLPRPWVVTDSTTLNRSQPLPTDGGAKPEALQRIGQWVKLDVPTTNSNTATEDDRCANVFNGVCQGFAAADATSNLVLVDAFTLLGSGMSACSSSFNGVALPSISGVWQGRFNSGSMITSYSIALANCSGIGVGTPYVGTTYAPASSDIQDLQANYPADKPLVTVHGVVVGVAANQTRLRTMFIQDPVAGPLSGIAVFQAAGLAPTPAVGDYVTVTATADLRGDYNQLVLP